MTGGGDRRPSPTSFSIQIGMTSLYMKLPWKLCSAKHVADVCVALIIVNVNWQSTPKED